jgi:alanine racemase
MLLSAQKAGEGPLLVSSSSDIQGSIVNDTIVARNCTLHVRGNLLGSLTIERGAKVTVEGSVDGKIINRGGTLVVNNKGLAACVTLDGPPEAEACGALKVNLSALAANWEILTKKTEAECAAVIEGNAYGCGIEPIAGALAKSGCENFFVSNLPEARQVRGAAPDAAIYVLNGFYSGTSAAFAEVNARPVINSPIQMAEWDAFVAGRQWAGSYALNITTGASRHGLTPDEAAALAPRVNWPDNGVSLLMSSIDHADKPDHPQNERQIAVFREVRRHFRDVPASLADASGILAGLKIHFDLVRAGSALLGVNPTPGAANPMQPVLELKARIVQVRTLEPGETVGGGSVVKRRTRLAFVSVGTADGYPQLAGPPDGRLKVMIGGQRCTVAGAPSLDLLPVDVTDLADPTVARFGTMVTLIGGDLGIDELAAATKSTAPEVLGRLGQRFHRIYYAI